VSKGHAKSFCACLKSKYRQGRNRLSDDLCRQIDLRKYNLLSGRLKKRFWRSRWSVVSSCPKTMNFLSPGVPKKQHGRCSISDVLIRGMAFITHNLPSGRFKKRIWWSRWSDILKCRKVMWPHSLLPGHQKKRIGRSRLSNFLSRRMGLRTNNLPSGRLKKRFWRSRWSVVSRCREATQTHFVLPGHRKTRLGRSRLSDV
jgi:hypothetical protein